MRQANTSASLRANVEEVVEELINYRFDTKTNSLLELEGKLTDRLMVAIDEYVIELQAKYENELLAELGDRIDQALETNFLHICENVLNELYPQLPDLISLELESQVHYIIDDLHTDMEEIAQNVAVDEYLTYEQTTNEYNDTRLEEVKSDVQAQIDDLQHNIDKLEDMHYNLEDKFSELCPT